MHRTLIITAFISTFVAVVATGVAAHSLVKPSVKSAKIDPGKTDPTYHLIDSVLIPGVSKWDYTAYDGVYKTLYVSHADEVDAIDPYTKTGLAQMPAHGSHGIAVATEFHRGFFTNGKSNSVGVFDLKTNASIQEVSVGQKPDAIVYDSATRRVFAMCGGSNAISVLDAATGTVLSSIDLGGGPEFGVADGKGHVFVNLEDKNETLMLDAKAMKVVKRWKLGTGEAPAGLSMDIKHNCLFVGCHNSKMIVLDAKSGKILATIPIGAGNDATVFDAETQLAFASNGDGTITIAKDVPHKGWSVVQTITTRVGAKTMAVNSDNHYIYLPSATFGPLPEPTSQNTKPKRTSIDGSFRILIYAPN
jgi:YVTN family beta-propeller protein